MALIEPKMAQRMEIKIDNTKYPTEPVQIWGKMKELRRGHFRHTWEAINKGEPIIQGIIEFFLGYFSGIGSFANPNFGPYFTIMMRDPNVANKIFEAAESAGYAHDLCSSMRCHLGQMVTGMSFTGPKGEKMKPDMVFQFVGCHSIGKTAQLFAECNDIPLFIMDFPTRDDAAARKYLKDELAEGIEWMEKVCKRPYQDEPFIHGVQNEWEVAVTMAEVCDTMKAVPAPFDVRQMHSLRLPTVTLRHTDACLAYCKELLGEAKDRVARGISARGSEKVRLQHEGIPPFPRIDILRYPVQWGGIFVASGMNQVGLYDTDMETGAFWPAPHLKERGTVIRTREDAFDLICDQQLHYGRRFWDPYRRRLSTLWRHNAYHCQGMVLHLDKGCTGAQQGVMEDKLWHEEHGVPVVTYEASQADYRDFDQAQIYDRLDAFMESLGLTKVETEADAAEASDEMGGAHGSM